MMAYFWLLLAIIACQSGSSTSPYPMSWDFLDVGVMTQDYWYSSQFPKYTNNGLKPIAFPSTNKSADYTSQTWMDPCYDRYYATPDASLVVFWNIDEEMFCEVLVRLPRTITGPVTYPAKYLFRLEQGGTRCPRV
ncbi:hypothetical protein GCK72_013076 [Caenorhabditis remanei]|uniref:Uncharacterized protein n=1 Tax=Caenorhabditis remanei TaxID=31234 RepID=A0A6A5GPV2_CAERE|nr:hypothetical protein GCK72_013076 [Caenorhabditis remanei]KAF1756623.1 hypothetical protein GCK72_013076 [Caenorhabditis remanei]